MKFANAVQGGLAGATTLSLLKKALQNIDTKKPKLKLLNNPGIIKKLKKKSRKNGSNKLLIEVSKELLGAATYYGIVKLGKQNALLKGALLGAATGVGVAFLDTKTHKRDDAYTSDNNPNGENTLHKFWSENRDNILTVGMYTAGGLLAGAAIKKYKKKRKKK